MRRQASLHHQPQGGYELDQSHWLVQKGIVFYSPAPGYALSNKGAMPPLSHAMPDSPDGTMELTVVGNATNYDTYAINLPGSTPFTLIAWGKVVDTTNDHVLFGVGIAGQNEQRAAISMDGADSGGTDRCYAFCKDGTAADQVFTAAGAYTANKWHMVTGVFGSATDMRIYRDGDLEGAQVSGVNVPTSTMTRAFIGSVPAVTPGVLRNGDRVSGCICVLGALTAAEVSRLYYEQLENPWSLLLPVSRSRRAVVTGGSPYTLSVDPTSYAITFANPVLTADRALSIDATSYATVFADAALTVSRTLDVVPASYAITFADPTLIYTAAGAYTLDVTPTSYAITFAEAAFHRTYVTSIDPTTYAITFANVTLTHGQGLTLTQADIDAIAAAVWAHPKALTLPRFLGLK